MAIFEDKQLPPHGATGDDKRDFRIAWLHRRVENLEAIIFELLRDRAQYEDVQGYKATLDNPGFAPSSSSIRNRTKTMAHAVHAGWKKENLGWPDHPNSASAPSSDGKVGK
ncbi:hypothetical protein GTW51_19005 [Aurantimonas aggregata]|uniref:Uncharacterized protein n=1 Tax=Aurantimonas aggregata TaxID=2047720 RepID=A0A6L9MMW0_9HYPH|nr:hypothetical protein [Aurantimonas aggregata]NDV88788.1 hypothetical protein [Aurantimonas aggregata]